MKKICFVAFLTIMTFVVSATENPLWLRYTAISPNGTEIAFTYKGDIFTVPTKGGQATQITTHASYDTRPVWSNDSQSIAFMSDREGGFDVFITNANGGEARQVTFNSTTETPYAFTSDDKSIIYGAYIGKSSQNSSYPKGDELYKISIDGGRPELLIETHAGEASISNDNTYIIYEEQRADNAFRKHHVSSAARDIWMYDRENKTHRLIFDWKGEDTDPIFSSDDQKIYFLSERAGSNNVFMASFNNTKEVSQVSSFTKHPVRSLSISDNNLLAYNYDGEIYTQIVGEQPQKVSVTITSDNSESLKRIKANSDGYDAVVSADGKQVAFLYRGNVFVTATDYGTTKQITNTPETEAGVQFSPDGRTIYYSSERGSAWNIYKSSIVRSEELNFANSTLLKEELLFEYDNNERYLPKISPDGKTLAYLFNRRELWVSDIDGKNARQVTDGESVASLGNWMTYSWSPDSKWFTIEHSPFVRRPYSNVAIVNVETKEIINLTESGYFYSAPRWVMDGNAVLHQTNRYGMRNHASWGSHDDVMITFLNKKAFDRYKQSEEDAELVEQTEEVEEESGETKKSKKKDKVVEVDPNIIVVEKDGLMDRTIRLTDFSSSIDDAILTKDGDKLYYIGRFQEGRALWEVDLKEKSTKMLQPVSWGRLQMDESGDNLFLFGNDFMKIGIEDGSKESISYAIDMKYDFVKEREYMFKHIDIQESKMFYKKDMHGVEWDTLTDEYARFLPYINNNYDYAEMLSEMLGELNVSHTGSGYSSPRSPITTARLGLFYDESYVGDGLKVTEVIDGSPFDNGNTQLEEGSIIIAVNGKPIKVGENIDNMFEGQNKKKTLITFTNDKKEIEEVVYPITKTVENTLLYKRWVKQRAELVDSLSGGRLGYVHIDGMDDSEFRKAYSKALGKYNQREGIVIDIRFNRGGRLHEDIEAFFSAEKYLTQVARGLEYATMPSRRWTKPTVMVVNEHCYSNAHGTPWVYRYKGMGKIVGMPVAGTMTTVSWETLQDESLYFGIPVIGYKKADGTYLENDELVPDVIVQNTPQSLHDGKDLQLEVAVSSLLETIDTNSK